MKKLKHVKTFESFKINEEISMKSVFAIITSLFLSLQSFGAGYSGGSFISKERVIDDTPIDTEPLDTLSSRQKYKLGENKVLEDTIKYKRGTNDFIVLDNGDGTYTLLKKGDSGTYKAVETK